MKEKFESRPLKIDWVLTNELAIGKNPKDFRDLDLLKKEGIKCILSLCSNKEAKLPNEANMMFICERKVLPDYKSGKVPTYEMLNQTIDIASELIIKGPTYIHCVAAMERSPLICMAWLVKKHKLNHLEALQYMMQIHKGTSPLREQLDLIKKFSLIINE